MCDLGMLAINSHEQTQTNSESAVFISLFWFGCSRGIEFLSHVV